VGAVGVVVVQEPFELASEAGLFGDEVAGEDRLPALIEDDGALHPFDAAVGLVAAGVDEPVLGAEPGDGGLELDRVELAAVEFLTVCQALRWDSDLVGTSATLERSGDSSFGPLVPSRHAGVGHAAPRCPELAGDREPLGHDGATLAH
jgi:hypothetical protein